MEPGMKWGRFSSGSELVVYLFFFSYVFVIAHEASKNVLMWMSRFSKEFPVEYPISELFESCRPKREQMSWCEGGLEDSWSRLSTSKGENAHGSLMMSPVQQTGTEPKKVDGDARWPCVSCIFMSSAFFLRESFQHLLTLTGRLSLVFPSRRE